MPAIPHVIRRGARYSYRRRLPVPFGDSRPITVSLGTSEPLQARQKGAALSLRWEGLVMSVRNRDELTAAEVRTLFQESLESELTRAVEEFQFGTGTNHEKMITNRIFAWAAEQALGSLENPSTLDRDQRLTVQGPVDAEREARMIEDYRAMIDLGASALKEVQDSNYRVLHRLPAPVSDNILRQATAHRLRGRLLARQRADNFYHPLIQRHPDHLGALLDEALVASLKQNEDDTPVAMPSVPKSIPVGNPIYLEEDTRRFTEVIDDVCSALQATNNWNADLSQRKRIMNSFAWITGDRRCVKLRGYTLDASNGQLRRFVLA